jgi:translation initiation factor 6
LAISLLGFLGSASIGVYSLATENMALVPLNISDGKAKKIEECLRVNVVRTTIGESILIGALATANSNGIVLPHYVTQEEIQNIKSAQPDINIAVMETKRTAYGNLVLSNDKGALADPRLREKDLSSVADALGVEVSVGEIAGLPYLGSLATATNKGVLAHPLLKDEERRHLNEVLKVPVDLGTVNCGIPYVGTGLIANSHGAVAGFVTTGPELFIIGQALDMVKKDE